MTAVKIIRRPENSLTCEPTATLRLSRDTKLSSALESHSSKPFSSFAVRSYQFCVPDEWYRRSQSRSQSLTSLEPYDSTVKPAAEENEDEQEHTAKQHGVPHSPPTPLSPSGKKTFTPDGKGTLSANRLSSLFDFFSPSPTSTVSSQNATAASSSGTERFSVSEPVLVDTKAAKRSSTTETREIGDKDSDDSLDEADFDEMMVSSSQHFFKITSYIISE